MNSLIGKADALRRNRNQLSDRPSDHSIVISMASESALQWHARDGASSARSLHPERLNEREGRVAVRCRPAPRSSRDEVRRGARGVKDELRALPPRKLCDRPVRERHVPAEGIDGGERPRDPVDRPGRKEGEGGSATSVEAPPAPGWRTHHPCMPAAPPHEPSASACRSTCQPPPPPTPR